MQNKKNNIKFLDNIAIADTAFTVKGKNESELFENAASALIMSMADMDKIEAKESRDISLESEKLDLLLFDFLNELLFYKDNENLLFSKFKVNVSKNDVYKLNANVTGETANPKKHKITTDIKAITMHMFKVEETNEGFEARVVIDI